MEIDPFSRRAIAADARATLDAFRAGGARPFHLYSVEEVRERYRMGCAANGIAPDPLRRVRDFDLGEFRMRVYEPGDPRQATPAIVFIHGGGWVMGDLDTHDGLARRLSTETGLPVMAIDYRLAPEHPYPAAIDDCRAALDWVFSSRSSHGIDVSSAVMVGDSAGGQLAAVLTNETVRQRSARRIEAQVLLYPVTDLGDEADSYARVAEGFPLVGDTMRWFRDLYVPASADRTAPDLSPLRAELPAGLPPTFLLTVDNDPLMDEGAAYAVALARAGATLRYEHLAGYAHGLLTSAGRIPAGERVVAHVAGFILRSLER